MFCENGIRNGCQSTCTVVRPRQQRRRQSIMVYLAAVTEVRDAADIDNLRWYQQGDASLMTAENLEKRAALREHPQVLAELDVCAWIHGRSTLRVAFGSASSLLRKCRLDRIPRVGRNAARILRCVQRHRRWPRRARRRQPDSRGQKPICGDRDQDGLGASRGRRASRY